MNRFIEWNSLEFKKDKGKEKLRCPECDSQRSDKHDKSLMVNHKDGYGKCFYCEALTFREDASRSEKEYTLPSQEWFNYTSLSDNLVKWCADSRKIRQETLIALGVTEESYYQPRKQKEVNNLVFNYFEGTKVVNKKYRTGDKFFTQSTGGKPIMYNINSVIGSEEVWIVEGEFDVLALYEVGIKSAISVPNGANDNDDYWINSEPYLKDVERFVIATDNDNKGNDLKEKIAQRLGRYRCEFVEFQNKDANGDLIEGVLRESIKERKRFPVGGTFSVSDLYDDIIALYDNGLPKTVKPTSECFGGLSDIWSTMRGHLVTVTGIPSHGKSSFVEWYCLNLVNDHNMKLSMFSPEHSPMELHHSRLMEKVTGKPFFGMNRATKSDIERYKRWADERVYLTGIEKGEFPTWGWLFERFKEQIYSYGIDIFVIDAFNKLDFEDSTDERSNIKKVLTKLTIFAQMHNVVVFLVAHPTKMRNDDNGVYEVPSLYDVSGSADFRNQTHDGFTIHRTFADEHQEGHTTFFNMKTKFQFQGSIGSSTDFLYNTLNGRYYARGTYADNRDWTLDFTDKQTAVDDYTPSDYCPF